MEDAIDLSVVDLSQLTSPDFPMPDEASYASAQDINVVQTALEELPTQYRKQHSHASSDEGSRY